MCLHGRGVADLRRVSEERALLEVSSLFPVTLNALYFGISMLERSLPDRRMDSFSRVAFRRKQRSMDVSEAEEAGECRGSAWTTL